MPRQEKAATTLWRGLKSDRVKIRYRRGVPADNLSVVIDAIRGRTEHTLENDVGVITTVHTKDFFVLASSLVLSGSRVEPERGRDWIELLAGDLTTVIDTFVVSHPSGSPPFEWMEPAKMLLRIHTLEQPDQ